MKGNLRSPVAEQVSRALDHPLPRFTKQLEAMHYIIEHPQEDTHDGTLLELAKLHSNLMHEIPSPQGAKSRVLVSHYLSEILALFSHLRF